MDFGVWIEPVLAKFCGSILGIEESGRTEALSTSCAIAAQTEGLRRVAQVEVRFAQTVTQRSRAGLNCVAPTALNPRYFGARGESTGRNLLRLWGSAAEAT
jgi:hypothetical protein